MRRWGRIAILLMLLAITIVTARCFLGPKVDWSQPLVATGEGLKPWMHAQLMRGDAVLVRTGDSRTRVRCVLGEPDDIHESDSLGIGWLYHKGAADVGVHFTADFWWLLSPPRVDSVAVVERTAEAPTE